MSNLGTVWKYELHKSAEFAIDHLAVQNTFDTELNDRKIICLRKTLVSVVIISIYKVIETVGHAPPKFSMILQCLPFFYTYDVIDICYHSYNRIIKCSTKPLIRMSSCHPDDVTLTSM